MESNFSLSDISAMMNGNGCNGNGYWNNPFMYLIWYALFRNGGFGTNGAEAAANVDINARLNSLSQQISDNHNNDITNAGISGISNAVNGANIGNLLGMKDMTAQMASCCCDIKSNILNQTNQLQSQIATLANGVQTGFANLGFLTQSQTNELSNVANANTQRILDKMCSDTTQELRDKLAEASQSAQTNYLISQLKTT